MTETARVREHLLTNHTATIAETIGAADTVAAGLSSPASNRREVVEPLTRLLERTKTLSQYPSMVVAAADALCEPLPASPVAAPPYVTITGTGPVLRASLASGRLVVRLSVFAVKRDPTRYVRTGNTPNEILEVERH